MHATVGMLPAGPQPDPGAGGVVQARGLVLAGVLRALSRIRPEGLYDYVSEGILASAMRQQHISGEAAGLLPSSWNVREGRGEGPNLSPELILSAMYAVQGYSTDVSHIRARVGPDRLFVASGATIHEANTSAMRLRLKLRWVARGEETFTTISGVLSRPLSVQYNTSWMRSKGISVPRRFIEEREDETANGWIYDPEARLLILKLRHTGGDDHLEIRWPDPKDRSPIERIDTRVKTDRG